MDNVPIRRKFTHLKSSPISIKTGKRISNPQIRTSSRSHFSKLFFFFFFLNYQMWHFLLILLLPSFEKGSYITITQNDMNFLRLSELKQREHFWLFGALKLLNAVSHTVP